MATDTTTAQTAAMNSNQAMITDGEMDRFYEEAKAVYLNFNATTADRFEFLKQTMESSDGNLTSWQMLTIQDLQQQFAQMMSFLTQIFEDMKQLSMSVIRNIGR